MKPFLMALSLLGWLAGGWGETLALRIDNDNGDPGLARSVWTQEYYVDEQGRLVRSHYVAEPEFIGEEPVVKNRAYHWEPDRVWWEEQSPKGLERTEYRVIEPGTIQATTSLEPEKAELNPKDSWIVKWSAGAEVVWETNWYRSKWSSQKGYSEYKIPQLGSDQEELACQTEWSKLTFWINGHEYKRVLLDKSPSALVGWYVSMKESLDGWETTGQTRLTGRGLWQERAEFRILHALLVPDELAMPFIFEKNYLR